MTVPHHITGDVTRRFLDRIEFTADGCWAWKGTRIRSGYGVISIHGRYHYAHRLSFEMFHGQIPQGASVLHRCDTPGCVNPNHLFTGTAADNFHDCMSKGRHAFGERHGSARLTKDDVLAIRASVAAGESHADVARRFEVDGSTISLIVNRKRWAHV